MLAAPLLKKDGGAMETWGSVLPVSTSIWPAMMLPMDVKKSAMAASALCKGVEQSAQRDAFLQTEAVLIT